MADLLLVEDDNDIAAALAGLLTDEGYAVHTAENGRTGLAQLASRLPDVVLLDVEMPVLDGPRMAHEMLVRDCGLERLPVILLSAVPDLPRIAERVGTPYFLRKPYDIDALLALIRRVLVERKAPAPHGE
jgi:DNA-binding NtrC family response regulator